MSDTEVKFCKRCGRKLVSKTSVDIGYGPSCWQKQTKPLEFGFELYGGENEVNNKEFAIHS